MIKQQIDQDLKKAMLAGDKPLVSVLRGMKSVILYAEVAQSKRDTGLSDAEILGLLQKESKKRQEVAGLYKKSGALARAQAELAEKKIIDKYLPEAMGEQELDQLVEQVIEKIGPVSPQTMGQIIGSVKAQAGPSADGALIARLVKERAVRP